MVIRSSTLECNSETFGINTRKFLLYLLHPRFVALGCAVVDVLDVGVVWVAQAVAVKDVSVCAQQIRLLS